MDKLYRVQMNKNGMPNFATAEEVEPKAETESIIEACVLATATREAYEEGMTDAWKIAQTVFGSTVTLYEAMDVAKCMKGVDDDL